LVQDYLEEMSDSKGLKIALNKMFEISYIINIQLSDVLGKIGSGL
jgi:hypothetical protein